MSILLKKEENEYQIYDSSIILKHKKELMLVLDTIRPRLINMFSNADLTKLYSLYNTFNLTSCDLYWYQLYDDLKNIIRSYLKTNKPLWFQCWINYHTAEEVLNWHNHDWDFHGYISLFNTNKTTTKFEKYEIKNKDGQIYIGPGFRKHKVVVPKNFKGYRVTLGFDIVTKPTAAANIGLIPI